MMKTHKPKDRLILALDVDSKKEAARLFDLLKDYVGIFKVGSQLFTALGPQIVSTIIEKGEKVFLDLKFHDIPNTVAKACVEAARLGVYMLNVHAMGGKEMMRQCKETVFEFCLKEQRPQPMVLGVTILTSIDQALLKKELCIDHPVEEQVLHLAQLAKEAGLDGVIASPRETEIIREACGEGFLMVTPGIRLSGSKKNDQRRTATPKEAIQSGADYIVVGRPIIEAKDHVAAAEAIIKEIEEALIQQNAKCKNPHPHL